MLSWKAYIIIYVLWNSYVFVAMGRDKRRAKLNRWRIPEARLLLMGATLGGVGLFAGMKYFHHKTTRSKFTIGAPLLIVANLLIIGFFYYIWSYGVNLF